MAGWKDDLSEITKDSKIDDRARNLIWLCLSKYDQEYFRKNPLITRRGEIAHHLKNSPDALRKIQSAFTKGLLKEELLDWITENKWQSAWIQTKVFNEFAKRHNQILFNPLMQLHGRAKSIALLDYMMCEEGLPVDLQLTQIDELKLRWKEQIKIGKKFEWLISDSALQHFENWFNLRMNTNLTFESLEDVQAGINRKNPSTPELLLLADQAKKVWNQHQRRSKNKDKKQRNFELSTSTITALEKIAKKHGISRTEVIEIVINAEARDEYHISRILSKRQALIDSIDFQ